MIRTLIVDQAAQDEAEAQVAYYAAHAGGIVALAFVSELEATFTGLVEGRLVGANHPGVRWRLPVKRVYLSRFPYAVTFFIDGERVHVVAIEALRRRPGYWRGRLRGR